MAKIDRVIIKVNGKVYSFLNPVFMDQVFILKLKILMGNIL